MKTKKIKEDINFLEALEIYEEKLKSNYCLNELNYQSIFRKYNFWL